jgi:hypothetical protein
VPNVTRVIEAYKANRWPELFKKSIAPIAQKPRAKARARMTW